MLTKFKRYLGIAVVEVAFVHIAYLNIAYADDTPMAGLTLGESSHASDVSVMTGATATRLGGEFRAEFISDNQGLYKHTGYSPSATSDLQVTDANVLLDGKVNADTDYAFRFNLLNPSTTTGPMDYGYGTHWFSNMFGFSIGKERIFQGGWDHLELDYRTHAVGIYDQNLALNDFDFMVALHMRLAGLLTLQIVNDVVQDPTQTDNRPAMNRWNKTEHPTWVVGWMGDFGPVQPLVDVGSYDNNKSRWVDVGVKTSLIGFKATLDFHDDMESYRIPVQTGTAVDNRKETDNKQAYTVNVSYEIKNLMTPWAYYSYYNDKTASDATAGLTQIKYNSSATSATTAGGYTYAWNNNGTVWGVGFDLNVTGKNWNPFLAYVSTSGKFLKAGSTTDTETRTDAQIKLGVLGQI